MKKSMSVVLSLFLTAANLLAGGKEIQGSDFVDAVDRVVKALEVDDYEKFESFFTEVTKGRQPDELWRGAQGVIYKFGKIQKLELSELDEGFGGAFVKVTFERAVREVFVRLTDELKIRELTYVAPANADQK